MVNEKLPPHDVDAEEAVIGSLLIDSESMHKIAVLLESGDFFREKNRWAYDACITLHERNEAINQITVAQELDRQKKLEALGGAAYLSHLVTQVPTSLHIEYYAQIVHRMAMMRKLIDAADQIAAIGYEVGPDVDNSIGRAEDILYHLHRREGPRDFVPIKNILNEYFEDSDLTPKEETGVIHQLPTGFRDIDNVLGGLSRSDMLVLGARPSMGKSSLAMNIIRNAAVEHNASVAIFSLEMSKEQVVHRFLSSEAGVDLKRVRLGQHTEKEEARIMNATGILSEASIFVDDTPFPSTAEIRNKARRLHNEYGINLIVIDYLQLIRGNGRSQNLVQEMSEISRSIKGMARDLNVPVIAISQLSRAVEQRQPKKIPQLSDLRESGGIEQDADIVMFIYRDSFYYTREEWEKQTAEPYPKGIADIIIAKHRNGPTARVKLYFRERVTKFENLSTKGEAPLL